jgi:hypothetical protein
MSERCPGPGEDFHLGDANTDDISHCLLSVRHRTFPHSHTPINWRTNKREEIGQFRVVQVSPTQYPSYMALVKTTDMVIRLWPFAVLV